MFVGLELECQQTITKNRKAFANALYLKRKQLPLFNPPPPPPARKTLMESPISFALRRATRPICSIWFILALCLNTLAMLRGTRQFFHYLKHLYTVLSDCCGVAIIASIQLVMPLFQQLSILKAVVKYNSLFVSFSHAVNIWCRGNVHIS